MNEFWNARYGATAFAYGESPNDFFKEQLALLKPGKLLLPAEGEGRNAVYAAQQGWEVYAFDGSEKGKIKAEALAQKKDVTINYQVGEFSKVSYESNFFDCIGLIYAHFPASVKSKYHQILHNYLKKEGVVIFEAFSKDHLHLNSLDEKVGGPKDIDMLFSTQEIATDFEGFTTLELTQKEVNLNEGLYHNGHSSVIRYVGKK